MPATGGEKRHYLHEVLDPDSDVGLGERFYCVVGHGRHLVDGFHTKCWIVFLYRLTERSEDAAINLQRLQVLSLTGVEPSLTISI
jgi:hypothetical protein